MEEFFRVELDGHVYFMPGRLPEDGLMMPIWSDGDPVPEIVQRLNQREGNWQPPTDVERKRLCAGHVDSSEFKALPIHEQFHELAVAYLRSANQLCRDFVENEDYFSIANGFVVYYCTHLAVELFLKAAIRARGGSHAKTHGISQLKSVYRQLFPSSDFHFRTLWDLNYDDLEQITGAQIGNKTDRKPDQVYRYFSGTSDELPSAFHCFSPGIWLFSLEELEEEWERIWELITQPANESE